MIDPYPWGALEKGRYCRQGKANLLPTLNSSFLPLLSKQHRVSLLSDTWLGMKQPYPQKPLFLLSSRTSWHRAGKSGWNKTLCRVRGLETLLLIRNAVLEIVFGLFSCGKDLKPFPLPRAQVGYLSLLEGSCRGL